MLRKWKRNNSNVDLIKVNAYAQFDQVPSVRLQDIERKRNSDDNQGPLLCCKFAKMGV